MSEILLALTSFAILGAWLYTSKCFEEERKQWKKERAELIDRIQAPSFAEYKQAEVKVIKASKEEPPTERIELL